MVTFKPLREQGEVRCEGIRCRVDGLKRPLLLDLTGAATARTAEKDAVTFACEVRKTVSKEIKIVNPTPKTWNLAPVIENECFSGAASLTVPPESTTGYKVTYMPLTMTSPRGKDSNSSRLPPAHSGSLFVPLPDGQALLYNLTGTAGPPSMTEVPMREVPSKVPYTEQLSVTNWLRRNQRFRVSIKRVKADASTVLKGYDYIDVPGGETRDFGLQFYAYREGTTSAEVEFKNEASGEFVAFSCSFKAVGGGVVDTVPLNTTVRRATTHSVVLDNPLGQAVTFSQTCTWAEGSGKGNCSEVHGPPSFRVPPRAKAFKYTFEYLPLREGETNARLTLNSSELGAFCFDLVLAATPTAPLPTERFSAQLGSSSVRRYHFTNFCTSRSEYSVSVDNADFAPAHASINAPPANMSGTEVAFDMTYTPSRLGDCKATMTISSPNGGEYTCPLFGQCTAPTPAGPFVIGKGKNAPNTVPFRNVFRSHETFNYAVDNPSFTVKASESYKSGESKDIAIKFDSKDSVASMGKLTVTCAGGVGKGVEWTFYLKGAH